MGRYVQTGDGNVRDTVTGFVMDIYYVVDLLNLKEKRINELEYESTEERLEAIPINEHTYVFYNLKTHNFCNVIFDINSVYVNLMNMKLEML